MASGKVLGNFNKRASEALKTRDGGHASRPQTWGSEARTEALRRRVRPTSLPSAQGAWIPSLDLPTVISIVGIGITIFQMYKAKSEHCDLSQASGAPHTSTLITKGVSESEATPLGMDWSAYGYRMKNDVE